MIVFDFRNAKTVTGTYRTQLVDVFIRLAKDHEGSHQLTPDNLIENDMLCELLTARFIAKTGQTIRRGTCCLALIDARKAGDVPATVRSKEGATP